MDALFVISLSLTVAVLVAMTAKAAILCRRLARISPRYVLPRMLFPASQIVCVAGIGATTMLLHLNPAILYLTLALGVACIPLDSLLFTALGKAEHADALREQARLLEAQIDPGKRFVVFKASVKGSYLVLDMCNSKSTSEGDEGRETTRRGILDRIRFAEEQTSGGSLAEHGWGLSVIDTIVQRYDGAVSLEHFKAGFRMSVMVDLAAQT